jgi:hypothetical protein
MARSRRRRCPERFGSRWGRCSDGCSAARHKIEWRVIYYTGKLAIAILDVFKHDTRTTPEAVIASCRRRLAQYQELERSW